MGSGELPSKTAQHTIEQPMIDSSEIGHTVNWTSNEQDNSLLIVIGCRLAMSPHEWDQFLCRALGDQVRHPSRSKCRRRPFSVAAVGDSNAMVFGATVAKAGGNFSVGSTLTNSGLIFLPGAATAGLLVVASAVLLLLLLGAPTDALDAAAVAVGFFVGGLGFFVGALGFEVVSFSFVLTAFSSTIGSSNLSESSQAPVLLLFDHFLGAGFMAAQTIRAALASALATQNASPVCLVSLGSRGMLTTTSSSPSCESLNLALAFTPVATFSPLVFFQVKQHQTSHWQVNSW